MNVRLRVPRGPILRLLTAGLAVGLLLLLSGCGVETAQNTFDPAGDVANRQRDLFNLVLWPAVVILVIVEVGLVYALVRFRQRKDGELPPQTHGNTRLELAWTIAPAILLLVLAVPTVDAIIDLGRAPKADALQVRVTGLQWQWQFEYLDPEYSDPNGDPLRVFEELHVPVDREIALYIESTDVVHSFWVPRLAGKLDAIPGRTNRMWLKATEPGSFSGQCAEFCGLGHADMRMTVMAESQEDFEAWIDDQLTQASAEPGDAGADMVARGE